MKQQLERLFKLKAEKSELDRFLKSKIINRQIKSIAQVSVLYVIAKNEGLAQSDISDMCLVAVPHVSTAIIDMEAFGIVKSSGSLPVTFSLTAKGRKLAKELELI